MNLDQKLRTALSAHGAGRLDEAETLYRDILSKKPKDAVALHHLGIVQYQKRNFDAAVELISKSIAVHRSYPEAFNNLGNVLRDQGKVAEAIVAHRQALRLKALYPEAYNNLGSDFLAQANLDEAITAFEKAVKLKPDFAEAHFNLGVAFGRQKKPDEAIAAYRQAIASRPTLREAHVALGVTSAAQGKREEAVVAFRDAIRLAPNEAGPYCDLGSALIDLGRLDEAAEACRQAIALEPTSPVAHFNLGVILQRQKKTDEAIAAFQRTIQLVPNLPEAHCALGLAFMDQGKPDEALVAYRRALELRTDYAEALINMGVALHEKNLLDEALETYRRALALKPDHVDALNNLGSILREQGKLQESIEVVQKVVASNPGNAKAQIQLAHLRRHACDWSSFEADTRRTFELVQGVEPFVFLNAPSTAAQQLACAQRWASKFVRGQPFAQSAPRAGNKIRIGYLSADFRRHATAFLMAELFERHDRARFETFAYSYGYDDRSEMRQRLIGAFDHFVEFHSVGHVDAARRIHDDGIDILIDLKGYTGGTRTEILVNRPAPIQVNYLGFPGTMGADFIDYIIADLFVTPTEHQPFYSEKIVQLPDCYQPNDTKRQIAERIPTRQECGLPEQGVVFCSFNGAYKFSPPFFDVWMRLLKAVPGSVLWLLATKPLVEDNLRREAVARGVAPERLVFCPGMNLPEHLARHRQADLFLDTLPINAHTTASDALWAGLPLLTCAGETFAGRVAGSLLHAVGLPELITNSMAEYEARALQLATEPAKLAELKAKLARNRLAAPLFDIDRFTRGLEAAYVRMWEIWRAGEPPRPIAI